MSDSATPWTIQSMEFSRPEYWSGLPFPSPGDLPNSGIEPSSCLGYPFFWIPGEIAGEPGSLSTGWFVQKDTGMFSASPRAGLSEWLEFQSPLYGDRCPSVHFLFVDCLNFCYNDIASAVFD